MEGRTMAQALTPKRKAAVQTLRTAADRISKKLREADGDYQRYASELNEIHHALVILNREFGFRD
jgi:hypothetical protein